MSVCAVGCGDDTKSPGVTQDATSDSLQLDGTSATDVSGADTTATTSSDTAVIEDSAIAQDTAVSEDTTVAQDTAVSEDTTVAQDTAVSEDTATATCGECLDLGAGPPDITLTTKSNTVDAPTLTGLASGSAAMLGDLVLSSVDVYPKGAFNGLLVSQAELTNNGESSGTNTFEADRWGYFLDLDLHYNLQTIAGPFEGDARQMVGGGGCYTATSTKLTSETGRCDSGWPDDAEPPSEFQYEYSDTTGILKVKIILSKEFILGLIPSDQQAIAGAAITGPLVFIATFIPPPTN